MSDANNPQGVGIHPLPFEIGVGVDTHELLAVQLQTAAYESNAEAATLLVYQLLRTVNALEPRSDWMHILNDAAMLLAHDEGMLDSTP
jgi:hypothetical protein|tara:strand:+ start:1703 stop:1966 length:264 start_codon:yes stop_codon:yes gene_type:complete